MLECRQNDLKYDKIIPDLRLGGMLLFLTDHLTQTNCEASKRIAIRPYRRFEIPRYENTILHLFSYWQISHSQMPTFMFIFGFCQSHFGPILMLLTVFSESYNFEFKLSQRLAASSSCNGPITFAFFHLCVAPFSINIFVQI